MKILTSCACATLLAVCAVPTCFAASSWNGTWKENEAKSKLTGDTVTYTMKGDGQFHFSNGGTIGYDFACDGKSYATLPGYTLRCTGSPAAGYDVTSMANGHVLAKAHRSFSADGKMMMNRGTVTRPDGSTYEYDETYKRESGTTGLAGKWLDVKDKSSAETVMDIMVQGDTMHIHEPANKEVIDAKLDGSEGTVTGPTIPTGASVMYKAEGPNKLHYAIKLNGKVIYQGTDTLSADGKSYTEEEWVPGRMAEKESVVFEKQ